MRRYKPMSFFGGVFKSLKINISFLSIIIKPNTTILWQTGTYKENWEDKKKLFVLQVRKTKRFLDPKFYINIELEVL